MKDKIAMKITEEEFNDIIPILRKEGKWRNIFRYGYSWCYITIEKDGRVELSTIDRINGYKILPYNKNEFLKYCGITVEESFEDYTKRVNPCLFSTFLAEQELRSKELKKRDIILTTEDGKVCYENDICYLVVDDKAFPCICKNFEDTYSSRDRKVFSTSLLAEEYIDKNKPQTTIDGFEIKRGEVMWVVDSKFFRLHQSYGGYFTKQKGNNILFGKKENAQDYIIENKRCYSYKDVCDILMDGDKQDNLGTLTRQKLGFT